jgi:sigma-B regulation protein RsbU (phosphoserine phosphatase)
MSSISMGSLGGTRRVYPRADSAPQRAFCYDLLMSADPVKPPPPLAGEVLAELLPIVGEINEILDPDALLPAIAAKVRRILDFKILDIFLPEPDGTLVPAYVEGYAPGLPAGLRLRPGQGVVGTAALTREPVFVSDVKKDPRYLPIVPDVAAEFAIPLVHRDRVVGVLNVEGPDVEAFTPGAMTALRVLASHLAIAIENATLHRETRWYAGLLATLYEIGKETASILDLDSLLSRVAEVVKRVIDYEAFGILLVDEASQELVLRKSVSYGTWKEKPRIKLGTGLCGHAALSKEPILAGDVTKDPRYINLIPETRSELVVPLIHKDKVVGVFDLESPELNRFNDEHLKVLTPLASQVAVAIENARLYQELRRGEERIHKELKIAQGIQHGLFPEECPSGKGWEASALFLPARELGGDLYDFYDIGSGLLGLAVGDVAGKGVPAALFGAFASGTVRARAFERHDPAALMVRVNRTLRRRGAEGMFCTLAYGLFDFEAKSLRLANSGLPYPLHYRADERKCVELKIGGLPLGSFEDSSYEEAQAPIATGDVFVFYTDGVTEARNGDSDYGVERLKRLVESHSGVPAGALSEAIRADLHAFLAGGFPADDVTLVVVKIL